MPNSDIRCITYAQALCEGLDQAMASDSRVIVIGEGVPDPKAIFGTTAELRDKYGSNRVFDMPLSENGLTGICTGAALNGMRPVMVHQRIDFALLALDQLVNNAAKWHYMFDGKVTVPLVVRVLIGRGWGQGPQHSQSLQAVFSQIPGLKVVMPMSAHDAKGMLISAIKDENPVIFVEHRWLYNLKDSVPGKPYEIPLNEAKILCEGTKVTIAAFSYLAFEALLAAKALSQLDIDVEVIDMRSVSHLDINAVVRSVKKTGRLLVADTGYRAGGVASELISEVVEKAFTQLKSSPIKIASPDHPVPTSHFMAKNYYPSSRVIADYVLTVLNISQDSVDYSLLCSQLEKSGPEDVPDSSHHGPF